MKKQFKFMNFFALATLLTTGLLLIDVYNAPNSLSYNQKFSYLVFSFFTFSCISLYGIFFKKQKQVRFFVRKQKQKEESKRGLKEGIKTIEGLISELKLSGNYELAMNLHNRLRDLENISFHRSEGQRSIDRTVRADLEESVHGIKAMMNQVYLKSQNNSIDKEEFGKLERSIDQMLGRMENLEVETMRLGVNYNVEVQLEKIEDKVTSLLKGLNIQETSIEEVVEEKEALISSSDAIGELISHLSLKGLVEDYKLEMDENDISVNASFFSNIKSIEKFFIDLNLGTKNLEGSKKLSLEIKGTADRPKLYAKTQLDDSGIFGAYTTPSELNNVTDIYDIGGEKIGSQVLIDLAELINESSSEKLNSKRDQAGQLSL